MSDLTQILDRVDQGEPTAAEELLALVYEELRHLAVNKMANERPGQTLQATALVHEAWLRLSRSSDQRWQGRAHFFAAAAEAMRRILVETARRKASQKRGGGQLAEELDEFKIELQAPSEEIVAVHEALDEFALEDKTAAEIVKLRYFVGMTFPEIAGVLQTSKSTVERSWADAKPRLKQIIEAARRE